MIGTPILFGICEEKFRYVLHLKRVYFVWKSDDKYSLSIWVPMVHYNSVDDTQKKFQFIEIFLHKNLYQVSVPLLRCLLDYLWTSPLWPRRWRTCRRCSTCRSPLCRQAPSDASKVLKTNFRVLFHNS